ncbi:MAG: zf-HC2 domain-containing protein [Planctomycetia bacterium]|nr:zf-HC2 domain-containing protein [Planctomycetia bacterium]
MTAHLDERQPSDDWQPAAGDEVGRLARRLRTRRTRRQFLKGTGAVLGGLLAVAGGWWTVRSLTREREYDFGGITCSEVMAKSEAIKNRQLPPEEMKRVKQHLTRCPRCKPLVEQLGGLEMLGQAAPICRRPEVV